jgi:predicted CXXCH cytochrome family protein
MVRKTSSGTVKVLSPRDGVVLPDGTLQVIALSSSLSPDVKLKVDGEICDILVNPVAESWRKSSVSDDSSSSGGLHISRGKSVIFGQSLLSPGEHVIEIGSERLRVFAKGSTDNNKAPADWPTFRIHPPPEEAGKAFCCAHCHGTRKGTSGRILGGPRDSKVCLKCHDSGELELVHMHRLESLGDCQICHEPHGSSKAKALKDDPKVLCTMCHE